MRTGLSRDKPEGHVKRQIRANSPGQRMGPKERFKSLAQVNAFQEARVT